MECPAYDHARIKCFKIIKYNHTNLNTRNILKDKDKKNNTNN